MWLALLLFAVLMFPEAAALRIHTGCTSLVLAALLIPEITASPVPTGCTSLVLAALLIPGIAAFPFHAGCTSISFANTFRFPAIPLREGMRHIHTLEHLQNITSPTDKPPYFDIQGVGQPQRYGDHVSVCVRTKVKGYPQTIYMLARPEHPETCTFMCVQDGVQRAMMQLRVSSAGTPPCSGHRLWVEYTYFTGPRTFDRDMEPVLRFLRFFDKRMRWQGTPLRAAQHPNLLWYRRMVLGLDASESPLD
jgi:hypothetical protein